MSLRRTVIIVNLVVLLALGMTAQVSSADVWIPDNQIGSYIDGDGVYTVIGAVKNSENYPIIPTIEIKITDDDKIISESYTLPVANPAKDIPFKLKFAQVSSENPILEKPQVTFVSGPSDYTNIEVVYDDNLIKHQDGHTSGVIANNGNFTVHGIKVYALIHGKDNKFIDVGKSVEIIEKLEPGEKKEFSIYPDPSFAAQVNYYSCFVIGDDMVIPTFVIRDDKRFDFRYKTEGYLTDIKYDNEKDALMLFARNPWPMKSFANIEFPMESESQKFVVYKEGKKIESMQSRDEQNTWHIVFDLEPQSSKQIAISGFESDNKSESSFNSYYLLGIIPAGAIIAGIFVRKKRHH
ncbi:MAG TPA: peptidase [Nitrosopumilaceae archaeon]|nr:peptidase [Nitrosopumilaceae archaeon]